MDHRILKKKQTPREQQLGYQGGGHVPPSGTDDAGAYFAAAGITSPTEREAVTTLIDDLKTAAIWPQLDYLFLCSPTSLAAALVNAKTTVSATNVGATHSSSGLDTGDTAYFYGTEVNFGSYTNFDFHCSVYSTPPNPSGGNGFIGYRSQQSRYNAGIRVLGSFATTADYGDASGHTVLSPSAAYEAAGGHYMLNVESSTSATIVVNGSLIATATSGAAAGISGMVATGNAFPIGVSYTGSTAILNGAFATIKAATVGRRLTSQQKTDLYTIITAYQTALGRA